MVAFWSGSALALYKAEWKASMPKLLGFQPINSFYNSHRRVCTIKVLDFSQHLVRSDVDARKSVVRLNWINFRAQKKQIESLTRGCNGGQKLVLRGLRFNFLPMCVFCGI